MIKTYRKCINILSVLILSICCSSYAIQDKSICEAKNFDDFFNQYTESVEMQKLCIKLPLEKLDLVEGQDDLVPRTQLLSTEQITYPLILRQQARKAQKLSLKIQTINNKKARVKLYKQDTGYKIIYQFKKNKRKKWKLIKIEDWSV